MRCLLFTFVTLSLLASPISADLVVPQTASNRILIPVAGDAAGALGTHFRSDINLINFRNAPQMVAIWWYPQGTSSGPEPIRTLTISARSGIQSEDFVNNILGRSGIGSIEIIGVMGDPFTIDPDARLHATARIWTPQPNVTNGQMSQTFPAIALTASSVQTKWIFGVRRTEQHRLNVGVTHNAPSAQLFRVTVVPSASPGDAQSFDMLIPARSMQQVSASGPAVGAVQVIVQNISATQSTVWQAWASSIDNITGDAWSQMAFPAPPAP